jgi:poly(ADP-ribose) polymerase-like protein
MSFNMWQKLMAASTENAVVAACCEVVDAVDALTSVYSVRASEKPSRAATARRGAARRPPTYNSAMAHVIEAASSGRAKCRSCDQPIAKGELRFGERQPNAFGEGEMTLWFHLPCAAYSRPEPFLELHAEASAAADGGATQGAATEAQLQQLAEAARFGIAHRRVPRLHGAERATSGRAHCRSCRELIAKGTWRLPLVFFEDYRFNPGGYLHAHCARNYFETTAILDRVRHFSPELREPELAEVAGAIEAGQAAQ